MSSAEESAFLHDDKTWLQKNGWGLFAVVASMAFGMFFVHIWQQETEDFHAARDAKIVTVPATEKQYYPDAVRPHVYFPLEGAQENLQNYEATEGQMVFYVALKVACVYEEPLGGSSCRIHMRMSEPLQAELKALCTAAKYTRCTELYP